MWTCGALAKATQTAAAEKAVKLTTCPVMLALNDDAPQDLEVSTTIEHEESSGMDAQTMFVVVGGIASCRRKFTMELVVRNAYGDLVRNGVCDDLVLVAELRFASSGRALLSDAEPAL